MKNTIFTGMATAIVTPMTRDGIDYEALGRFLEFQIENGINAIVVMGTTGENATIEYADQKEIIRFTVEKVAGRVPVIAGTGTNNTEHVLHNTRISPERAFISLIFSSAVLQKTEIRYPRKRTLVWNFCAVRLS